MNAANKHFSSALKKAARGTLDPVEPSNRASSVYGFKNRALQMSSEELKAAWMNASRAIKAQTQKG